MAEEICELAHEEDSSGSDNDSGTDPEEVTGPPEPKRSRKHSRAATYRTKFNPDWKSSPSLPPCLRIHTGMFMSVLLRDELVKYTTGVGGSLAASRD